MDYFHHGRNDTLFLLEYILTLDKDIFLTCNAYAKTTISGLAEIIIHFHGFMAFHIAFPLTKEFLSEQNCGNRLMLMEFTGIITDLSATIAW